MQKNTPLRTTRHLLLAAGLVLTFEASSLGQTAPEATETTPGANWSLVAASGQVDSRGPLTQTLVWGRASRGQSLLDRSWVRTGTDGRATVTQGDYIVMVDPDTEIQLISSSATGVPTRVEQSSGSATYRVRKGRHQKFQVLTPYLVAGVKGTVFRVDVTDGFADVDVSQGVVAVWSRDTEGPVDVGAGETIRVEAVPGERREMMAGGDRAGFGAEFGKRAGNARGFLDEADLQSAVKLDGEAEPVDRIQKEDERDFFLEEDTKELDNDVRLLGVQKFGPRPTGGPAAPTKPVQPPGPGT